jgi:hypothetical protein
MLSGREDHSESATAETHLVDRLSALDPHSRSQLVILRLVDDLEDQVLGNFTDAKNFRSLFPVDKIPSVSISQFPSLPSLPEAHMSASQLTV